MATGLNNKLFFILATMKLNKTLAALNTIVLAVALITPVCCLAQKQAFIDMASPKLSHLIAKYPDIGVLTSNVLSEAFTNRSLRLLYFYNTDKSLPGASHWYPDATTVYIAIQENQEAPDEVIWLLFEALNSEGEYDFGEICRRAKDGTVSRSEFGRMLLKVEFRAVKRTRDILLKINKKDREILESLQYKRFTQCPEDFEAFVNYSQRLSRPNGNVLEAYEKEYDKIRNE